ncbi:MAG: helix-turn-helix transcriptional regulator [Bacteroidales bacterium]|nr:helix-turn-helix transcriptional regulator [Bacteroidales bacterium]
MIERIKKIIEVENIGMVKFADEIGIGSSALSHYLRGRNKISLELVTRILERFRGVNPEWLLFGRGEMYKSTDAKVSSPVAEPSLFDNQPSVYANYPTIENKAENSPSIDHDEDIFDSKPLKDELEEDVEPIQQIGKQENDSSIKPQKTIERILIMYSDSTFDSYSPNGHRI